MPSLPPQKREPHRIVAVLTAIVTLALVVTTFAAASRVASTSANRNSIGQPGTTTSVPDYPWSDSLSPANAQASGDDADALRLREAPAMEYALDDEDGYIPDGEVRSPFDTTLPAIANLDVTLLAAVQSAAIDARADGLELDISSGWRSARYQESLLDEAIEMYGSETEARKWVNTPERSAHVTGDAVDVGPTDVAIWLGQHGNAYGLCQTYANEIWHFELAIEPGGTCPEPLRDASTG